MLGITRLPKRLLFKGISLNSAYKQCGDSVVVPVIRRIAEKNKSGYAKWLRLWQLLYGMPIKSDLLRANCDEKSYSYRLSRKR